MFGSKRRCFSILYKGHTTFTLVIFFSVIYKIIYSSKTAGDTREKLLKIPLRKADNILSKDYKKSSYRTNKDSLDLENNKSVNNESEQRRSRRNVIRHLSSDEVVNIETTGTLGRGYYLEMLIGTPTQTLNILIDTGSSNFAIASTPHPSIDKFFNPSSSSTFSANDRELFTIPYTQGLWIGYFGKEMVSLPPLAAIETTVGFMTQTENFFVMGANWQGIMGLAYAELARPSKYYGKATIWEDIVQSLNIADVFSLSLCRSNGSLTLGGTDEKEYLGGIHYISLKREWFYDVLVADILVGNESLNLDCKEYNFDKVIIDSGTTYMYFPPTTFHQLVNTFIKNDQLGIPEEFWLGLEPLCYFDKRLPWDLLPNFTLSFFVSPLSSPSSPSRHEVVNLTIGPGLYIKQVYISSNGWFPGKTCYKFSVAKARGAGTVIGATFMEGFYTVFDRQNKRVGFAVSSCIEPGSSNIMMANSSGYPSKCAYNNFKENASLTIIFISICVLVSSLIFFSLAFFVIKVEFFQVTTAKTLTSEPKSPTNLDSLALKH